MSSSLPKPLPRVPGPKLAPFTRTGHASIQFIKELGEPGADGHVWEVEIRGKRYALKMFLFNRAIDLKGHGASHFARELSSPHFYSEYIDPFNCECRAYGRLKEENRDHLAIPAHGYLLLTPAQELEITALILGCGRAPPADPRATLKGRDVWRRHEEHRGLPIRAIVKEIAEGAGPFAPEDVPQMWADLEALHEAGILVRDIHAYNYIGGRLIDFSRAWTTPHPGYTALDLDDVRDERRDDPDGLYQAVTFRGKEAGWGDDYVAQLVPEELVKCALENGPDRYGTDPRAYNWLKWEKDPVAVDLFIETHVVKPWWAHIFN